MGKTDDLRAMRERNFAQKSAKTSRGSADGSTRTAAQRVGPRQDGRFAPPVQKASEVAGIKPGPRGNKTTEGPASLRPRSLGRPVPKAGSSHAIPAPATSPKVGRPRIEDRDKTLAALKPWKALGMSESTWRRRQKGGAAK